MKENEQLIAVGKVINTHGHKGEVKVYPLTDDPARMEELSTVIWSLDNARRPLSITQVRYQKNMMILSFAEIEDMNEAIILKNGTLNITKDELRQLPEGKYYIFDIIGLRVYTDAGLELGKVTNVLETGANDVYEVEDSKSGKKYLIPALKHIVQSVDLDKQEIIISPLEGLLE